MIGQKPVSAEMIDSVLAHDINGLESTLTRQGYSFKWWPTGGQCQTDGPGPFSRDGCRPVGRKSYVRRCWPLVFRCEQTDTPPETPYHLST